MRIRWRGLELPSRVVRDDEVSTDTFGRFIVEPFERGFGTTVGNSLRRILLSSLEGAAVTSVKIAGAPHEFTSMPGVPTAEEAGVPDLKVSSFNILCTTAGTPASVIATLYDATRQVLASDAFVKFLQSNGLDPVPGSTPESATRFVREQIAVLTPLIIATKEKS